MADQAIIEAALNRRAPQKGPAALAEHNRSVKDWWGKCRRCSESVRGGLADLEAHRCNS